MWPNRREKKKHFRVRVRSAAQNDGLKKATTTCESGKKCNFIGADLGNRSFGVFLCFRGKIIFGLFIYLLVGI